MIYHLSQTGNTPLHLAVHRRQIDIVAKLLRAFAPLNAQRTSVRCSEYVDIWNARIVHLHYLARVVLPEPLVVRCGIPSNPHVTTRSTSHSCLALLTPSTPALMPRTSSLHQLWDLDELHVKMSIDGV